LSQDQECPPIYLTQGELKHSYTVARKPPAPRPAAAAPTTPAAPPAIGAQEPKPATGGAQLACLKPSQKSWASPSPGSNRAVCTGSTPAP
jgi:hypothetical protein